MTRTSLRVAAALALVSLLALGGCGSDDDGGAVSASDAGSGDRNSEQNAPFEVKGEPVATDKVTLPRSYKFEPAVISVSKGTTVTWENKDNFPHNVKVFGDDEQLEDLPVNGEASITFDDAGVFYYQCTLHPSQMKGKIVVE